MAIASTGCQLRYHSSSDLGHSYICMGHDLYVVYYET
eukprot:COSAG02_NODE_22193_length_760_cov_1.511346_1_plen_36_part_01